MSDRENMDFGKIDWIDAASKFGIDLSKMIPTKHYPCPLERDAKPRFRFDNKAGRGTWICTCGSGDGVRLIARAEGCSDTEAIFRLRERLSMNCPTQTTPDRPVIAKTVSPFEISPEKLRRRALALNSVWERAIPIAGTPAQTYLERRVPGLMAGVLSDALKYHPRLEHREDEVNEATGEIVSKVTGYFPVLVAKIVDLNGVPVSIHRTYLSPDGYKAAVESAKKLMPGVKKLDGAAIPLNIPEKKGGVLIVSEGIETGLAWVAATNNKYSAMSLINAGNLAQFKIPPWVKTLIIAADRDKICRQGYRPGEHYAEMLQKRALEMGLKVILRVPDEEGVDFCDVWLRRQSA